MDNHPHPHDVICGRGKGSYLHIGNFRFHKLVDSNKEIYSKSHKTVKTNISKSIINVIRSQNPPGRFIEYDACSGSWLKVDNKRAVEKASQALRERKSKSKHDTSTFLTTDFSGVYNTPLSVSHNVQTEAPNFNTQIKSHYRPSNLPTLVNNESERKPMHYPSSAANLSSPHNQPNRIENEINHTSTYPTIKNESGIACFNDTQAEVCISSSTGPHVVKTKNAPQTSSLIDSPLYTQNIQLVDENEERDFFKTLRELRRKKIPFPKFSEEPNVISGEISSDICLSCSIASPIEEGDRFNISAQTEAPISSNISHATNEYNALDCTHAAPPNKRARFVIPIIPSLMPIIPMLEPYNLGTSTFEQSLPVNETSPRPHESSDSNNMKSELINSILSNPEDYTIFIFKNNT